MPTPRASDEEPQYSPRVPAPPEAIPDYTEAGAPASEGDPRGNTESSKAE